MHEIQISLLVCKNYPTNLLSNVLIKTQAIINSSVALIRNLKAALKTKQFSDSWYMFLNVIVNRNIIALLILYTYIQYSDVFNF